MWLNWNMLPLQDAEKNNKKKNLILARHTSLCALINTGLSEMQVSLSPFFCSKSIVVCQKRQEVKRE